jgi:hypothetical protein
MRDGDPPWLARTLQVLDLRRRDRLLLVLPGSVMLARSAASLVGSQGEVTVLEPRRRIAEAIAEALPRASVLALEPTGDERFGSFDAVLVIPFAVPMHPAELWAGLVAANLRPGGRFAIDLPAPDPMPDVRLAAMDAHLPCAEQFTAELRGPDEEALTQALQARGLRRVETLLGTHLVQFASPFDLADLATQALRLDADQRLLLGEAIARRLQSTASIETLMHRTSVAGMR